jgi:hypothetical protein
MNGNHCRATSKYPSLLEHSMKATAHSCTVHLWFKRYSLPLVGLLIVCGGGGGGLRTSIKDVSKASSVIGRWGAMFLQVASQPTRWRTMVSRVRTICLSHGSKKTIGVQRHHRKWMENVYDFSDGWVWWAIYQKTGGLFLVAFCDQMPVRTRTLMIYVWGK